ncbi:DUF4249 family protein [Flavobacterium sp. ASW18X]|uniref:DUF4249 family protein n=1 Tax=Flavobacterium sp. ASW18X TaxID=2572595 RepID=UPI0010AE3D37|nr:DUF4249 family protein [Flavobacterium sp. ASW18X]TKD65812.1 DUF4249 domain-containing protein [Flavobacterium sp. ASW18X]
MIIKKITPILFLAFCLVACEDTIDVDLETTEPRLVIDAIIGYNDNDGEPVTIGEVKLTLTTAFFDEEVPIASGAEVALIDESTKTSYPLTENEPGVFRDGIPNLEFNTEYTLRVVYQGETYEATTQLMRTGTINSVTQGDGYLFDEEEETEVIVDFSDVIGERNYYLFAFGFNNFLVTDDEYYIDEGLKFSYYYEEVEPGDLLTITLLGIDKDFADYTEQILTQSGEDGSGGFGIPPANVRGNFYNTTNPENYAFGYFAISEAEVALIRVQ